MHRVPEVIDVWFDSGSMPFAQFHAPHENIEHFEQRFPADFICEALDQTRGWFYSLLAVSTLLFDRSSYRNVVCLGLILDEQGRKMSKSLGNTVEPWEVIDRYGADALRWYFFTSKQPWDGYRFSLETIGEAVRQFLLQLWNTYGFYVLYANANGDRAGDRGGAPAPTDLDRWALSRLQATVEIVRERLDDFDATDRRPRDRRRSSTSSPTGTCAARAGASGTAIRPRSRPCASAWSRSPSCSRRSRPFIADEIYDNLDGAEPSVHLCDFPEPGERDRELEQAMAVARETVRLGLAARGQAKLKVRQPLRAAVVVATGREREAIERLAELVREELNVRELRFVSEADELGQVEIKPNYRTLGPAVRQADAAGGGRGRRPRRRPTSRRRCATAEPVAISVGGHRPRARRRGPAGHDEAARGLPGRARGLARGRARARDRRRAARRGLGARDRPRGPERPPGGRARGLRPDRADARRRRRAARRRPRRTRTTSPARRWRSQVGYESLDGAEPVDDRRARPLKIGVALRLAA